MIKINYLFCKLFFRSLIVLTPLTISACGSHGHSSGEHHDDAHGHESGGHHDSVAGLAGDVANIDRTVSIDMNDQMEFIPARIEVGAGETIRFAVKNSGKIRHEFVIGSNEEIMEHHELMKKFPGMEHGDEPNSVSLESGENGEVIWQFTKAGTFDFACLQPGHFEAGMKGDFMVSDQ